ncbi:MAG: RNA polymerase sigma factor [Spirochaetes bacterium]|nr:RNA polymerase sigma factor [Spirochaetota bacterium]
MFEDKNDAQLVQITLTDEDLYEQAFKEIYNRYYKRIFKMIHNSVDNIDDCMDLLQQTFLNVFKYLNRYNSKYQFTTWIYKITTNNILNYKRHKVRSFRFLKELKSVTTGTYYPDYADMIYKEDALNDLNRSLRKLPEKFGMPLLLSAIGELKTKEIAGILKITQSGVRKRIMKAKEMLKKDLKIPDNDR